MSEILGTLLAGLVLALAVGGAIVKLVRDRRRGKSVVCGGDCSACRGCCGGVTREEFEKLRKSEPQKTGL